MGPLQQAGSLEHRIQCLERQGWRLSSASLVALLVPAAAALIALLVPAATSGWIELQVRGDVLWKASCVFLVLALTLGLYALSRQRSLRQARGSLVHELARLDAMEKLMLLDPLTETYNRRHLEEIIRREVSRVERHDTSLTFLKIEVGNLDELTIQSGGEVGECVVKEVAQMLKRGLRPTDMVVRYETSEFLVVMPETSKHGALAAVRRLLERMDGINLSHLDAPGYPIVLNYGMADYTKGVDVRDVLAAADHSIRLYRDREQTPGSQAFLQKPA